jgi:hypothetical protein
MATGADHLGRDGSERVSRRHLRDRGVFGRGTGSGGRQVRRVLLLLRAQKLFGPVRLQDKVVG